MTTVIEREIRVPVTRVRESCAPCRRRKSRCDAAQPCSSCTIRGTQAICTYAGDAGGTTTRPTRSRRTQNGHSTAHERSRRSSSSPRRDRSTSAAELDRPTRTFRTDASDPRQTETLQETLAEVRRLSSTVRSLETHVHALSSRLVEPTAAPAGRPPGRLLLNGTSAVRSANPPRQVDPYPAASRPAPRGNVEERGSLLGAGPRPTAEEKDNWDTLRRALPSKEDCEVLLDFLVIECDFLIHFSSPIPQFVAAFERSACSPISTCLMASQLALSSLLLDQTQHDLYCLSKSPSDIHQRLWGVMLACSGYLAAFDPNGPDAVAYVDFARTEDLYMSLRAQDSGPLRLLNQAHALSALELMDTYAWEDIDPSVARKRQTMLASLVVPLRFRVLQLDHHESIGDALGDQVAWRPSMSPAPHSPTNLPPFAGLTAPLEGPREDARWPVPPSSFRIFRLKTPSEVSELAEIQASRFQLSGLAGEIRTIASQLSHHCSVTPLDPLPPELGTAIDDCLVASHSRNPRLYTLDTDLYGPDEPVWTDYMALRALAMRFELRHRHAALRSTLLLAMGQLGPALDPARAAVLMDERQRALSVLEFEMPIVRRLGGSRRAVYPVQRAREPLALGAAIVAQMCMAGGGGEHAGVGRCSSPREDALALVRMLRTMEDMGISVLSTQGTARLKALARVLDGEAAGSKSVDPAFFGLENDLTSLPDEAGVMLQVPDARLRPIAELLRLDESQWRELLG